VCVRRPASEWKAPLLWSALGLGLFAPAVTPMARIGYVLVGGLWVVPMAALALYNGTTEVAANANGLRWEEVGGVETRELVPTTRSLVFTGRGGMRRLMDICAARTGLTGQFRRVKVPDL
jgi:hypothetical protein